MPNIIRRSAFTHLIDLAGPVVLAIHAVSQTRVTVTSQVADLIRFFDTPAPLSLAVPQLEALLGADQPTIHACIARLVEQGLLTNQPTEDESAAVAAELTQTAGRDPTSMLDSYRRARMEGAHPYWAVEAPRALTAPQKFTTRLDVILLGDCDLQMETDFLRREAAARGIDLRAAASFPADTALAAERKHDAIIIGSLQARHAIVAGEPGHHGGDPSRVYIDAMQAVVRKLHDLSSAPILIDTLPEPTLQPLGFADHGVHSHRNRIRRTNLALAQLAEDHPDVHLVDLAATLNAIGSETLLDDGLVGFTHFGSPGWMLQRPADERAAVHHQFPDLAPLADRLGGDPYRREAATAKAHADALQIVLAINQKKCVIVDLDGILWPGVLAETGSPFAWTPELGGPNSYIGLYFGIHEALRSLRQRGILLACVSKNDEATVRSLWHYDQHYPRHRLLTFDHFVTTRINWQDKAANIQSIADELGFPLSAFAFIDDTARERERVRQTLPDITILGEDLFSLRRVLLTDPAFQPLRISNEAANRTALVKAQLDRTRLRAGAEDEAAFICNLDIQGTVRRLDAADQAELARVRELIARTTQFNATGAVFSAPDLQRINGEPDGAVYILAMRDRLADHGLVGVAIVRRGEILNLVVSCRVAGLGAERRLLDAVIAGMTDQGGTLVGSIIPTDRNLPIRNLYSDHGFTALGPGTWTVTVPSRTSRILESTTHA